MLKLIVGGAAALVLWGSAGGAMAAETAPAAQMELATTVSRQIMSTVDLNDGVQRALSASTDGMFATQPQWRGLLADAFRDQIARDQDLIVVLMARTIAPRFSEAELKAGAVILEDPMVRAAISAAAKGEQPRNPQASKATLRVMQSPAGEAFLKKFADAGVLLRPVQEQLITAVMPGVFRNFGEKAEALETARRAAEGLPASKP